ncbi:uncharacterized protein AtWU_01997 [Aspergillus tubingensis]|uniref:uncharacterized protein n=1 Tax=Aspergillus tubingensis TaxID=5068 RepID=UPI001578536F|nr:uncharacterized protein AtWU_01997 [Aspergillus tubingensis]GFN12200.1 hypothetical protein AtWU_01997 [Aspergillus tubingensis]
MNVSGQSEPWSRVTEQTAISLDSGRSGGSDGRADEIPPLGHLVVMRFRLLVTGHHGLRCPLLVMNVLWKLTKPVVFGLIVERVLLGWK